MPPKKVVVAAKGKKGTFLDRYTPEMNAFKERMLNLYPGAAEKKIGMGGFSEIYELPHNRVLRIGLVGPYNASNYPRAMHAIQKGWQLANASDVTPRVEYVADFQSNWRDNKEGIVVSVMSRVTNIVPFPEWAKLFDSDVEIAKALFRAAEKLEAVNIIHADPNAGNVLVRKNTNVVFIDLDDLCLSEGESDEDKFFCKREVGTTQGYRAPEYELSPAKKSKFNAYLHSAVGRKHSMYAGLMALTAAAFKQLKNADEMTTSADAPKMLKTPGLKAIAEQIVGPIDKRPKSARDMLMALTKLSSLPAATPPATVRRQSSNASSKAEIERRPSSPCAKKGKVQNPRTKRCIAVGGRVHRDLCRTGQCP